MAGNSSPYYPPRARWHSPLRYFWINVLKRAPYLHTRFQQLHHPLSFRQTILSLLIPGFVFRAFGHHRIAKFAMCGCVVALLIYFVWLGYTVAAVSFAAILSLHVSSIAYLLKRFSPESQFLLRLVATVAVLFALNSFVYGFIQKQLEKIMMPLRIGENVVVVKGGSFNNLKRGDWIAYRVGGNSASFNTANLHGNIVIEEGFGLEPLIAGPGDTVRFSTNYFQVNEKIFPGRPFMPANGELMLMEKQWLVWPKFAIRGNGIPEGEITHFLRESAVISENEIVGRPFERWFWRKQILK